MARSSRKFMATMGLAIAAWLGCRSYIPARFAARAPIEDARDRDAEPVPSVLNVPEPVYLSEVYLHQPLRDALYLSSSPPAKDINAFDEVPRSSWFEPRAMDIGIMARGPGDFDAPHPPFDVLPDAPLGLASSGFCIRDARGQLYEMAIDPADRPEMRTGALAVAARLVWALGLNTPPVMVTRVRLDDFHVPEGVKADALSLLESGAAPVDGFYRVTAVAWPTGKDLGRSPETGTRADDPNDVVAHEDRRTMRALEVFASWIALGGLGPAKTLDRYLGAPGQGHVVHFFAGLDDALGASNVARVTDPRQDLAGGSPFVRLLTLGLLPSPPRPPTQVEIPAVGGLSDDVDPGSFEPPMPYAPAAHLLASDGYWAAKRIGLLSAMSSSPYIALAIEAGKFSDLRAQQMIQRALETRGRKIAGYWFARVVPVELVSFRGSHLQLRDEGVALGLFSPNVTDYRFDFKTGNGDTLNAALEAHPIGSMIEIDLPDIAARTSRDYLVIQVLARRNGVWVPRMVELHIRPVDDIPIVVGIRH